MSTRISRPLSIIVMVAMLFTLGAGAVFAQDATLTPGDGPGTAVHPTADAVTIAPHSWQWYVFRSQVPVNVDSDGNDIVTNPEDATVNATLRTVAGDVSFEVWSADDYNNWVNNKDFFPMGSGTENEFIAGDPLFWQGSFPTNSNYYLIVMNNSGQSATYTLDITGNMRFPTDLTLNSTAPAAMAATTTPAQSESVMSSGEMALTVETPAETTMGTGPENALMPANGYVMIAANTWQWYSFHSQVPVNVDSEGNDIVTNPEDATINALLRTKSGNVSFEVWSTDNLSNWRNSSDFDAMGKGTTNEFISGDPLFWQGSFPTNSTYYLIVKNSTAQPAYYSLSITGNVSFPTASSLPVQ